MISQFDDLVYNVVSSIGWPSGMTMPDFFALINAVIQKESSFNPNANPDGDHIGLMQVSSSVWGIPQDVLFDPANNINAGASILYRLINQYGLSGALGAYRLGPLHRFEQTAVQYAQTVLSYFSNFRSKVMQLFSTSPTVTGGEYFTGYSGFPLDTSPPGTPPDITTPGWPQPQQPLDTSGYPLPSDTGPYGSWGGSTQADYTWLFIAAGVILILAAMR